MANGLFALVLMDNLQDAGHTGIKVEEVEEERRDDEDSYLWFPEL